MRLADRLGKTYDEITSIPSSEVTKWMAFDKIKQEEDQARVDDSWHQTASIIYWMVQLHADKDSKRKIKYEDLLPRRVTPKATTERISDAKILGLFLGMKQQAEAKNVSNPTS